MYASVQRAERQHRQQLRKINNNSEPAVSEQRRADQGYGQPRTGVIQQCAASLRLICCAPTASVCFANSCSTGRVARAHSYYERKCK